MAEAIGLPKYCLSLMFLLIIKNSAIALQNEKQC